MSDPNGVLATPHGVVERGRHHAFDHGQLAAIVGELHAERVVVGLPLSLDGSTGPAARQALAEIEELAAVLPVPVEAHDERLTTVTAARSLSTMGVKRSRRRQVVDQVAASVILQSWLDANREGSS